MKLKIEKDLILKMSIIGVSGVAMIIALALLATTFMGRDSSNAAAGDITSTILEEDVDVVDEQEEEAEDQAVEKLTQKSIMLIKEIDEDNGYLKAYDIQNDINLSLKVSSAVTYEDEYGTPIVLSKLSPGYIVYAVYDANTYDAESVKIDARVETLKNLSSFVVDEELKRIEIGSRFLDYDDNIIALKGDEQIPLSDVTIADDVVVRVYENQIWSVIIESGHGYIVLSNYDAYLEGRLEIGNRTSYTIIEDMNIPVAAGVHQVVITKEDMAPYSNEIFVEEGEEFVIDLSEYEPKVATVLLDIEQEGSTVYLDDVILENPEEEMEMDYGQYNIRVENPGFQTWEGIIVVDQVYVVQHIDMEVVPLYLHMNGPDGAEFYLDGILQGVISGNEPISVPVVTGSYTLVLRKEGYKSWTKSVYIEDQGQDYFYTVSALEEIPQETEPVEPEDTTETDTTETTNEATTETPTDDTYVEPEE